MSYGKVKESFWTDKKILALSDDAKMLALYLLTGPHRNLIGCMRIPNGYLLEDLKWPSKRLSDAIAMLSERHFICRDDDGWTLILNQLKHDPIKVPNHGKAAIALANEVPPESVVYQQLIPRMREALEAINMASEWHPQEIAIPEPLPSPEPLPEPEPAPEPGAPDVALAPPEPTPAEQSDIQLPVVVEHQPTPPAALSEDLDLPQTMDRRRGTRLPVDWGLPSEWRNFALAERPDLDPDRVWPCFCDYWIAQPGQKGVKTDWFATWRNWVRKEGGGPRVAKSATMQALDELQRRFGDEPAGEIH